MGCIFTFASDFLFGLRLRFMQTSLYFKKQFLVHLLTLCIRYLLIVSLIFVAFFFAIIYSIFPKDPKILFSFYSLMRLNLDFIMQLIILTFIISVAEFQFKIFNSTVLLLKWVLSLYAGSVTDLGAVNSNYDMTVSFTWESMTFFFSPR